MVLLNCEIHASVELDVLTIMSKYLENQTHLCGGITLTTFCRLY